MKVYIVTYTNGYDDWGIERVFATEEQARQYVAERRTYEAKRAAGPLRSGYNYDYDDYDVDPAG